MDLSKSRIEKSQKDRRQATVKMIGVGMTALKMYATSCRNLPPLLCPTCFHKYVLAYVNLIKCNRKNSWCYPTLNYYIFEDIFSACQPILYFTYFLVSSLGGLQNWVCGIILLHEKNSYCIFTRAWHSILMSSC